jgi:hypothetical protein
MTTYLSGGWYRAGDSGLRTEVVDGAMDAAGYLHRAGVGPGTMTSLALKVRSLMTIIDPQMTAKNGVGEGELAIVGQRLTALTDQSPELHAFVSDCLEHVQNRTDLMAFYLHLVHVTRMLQLLGMAHPPSLTAMPGPPAWAPAKDVAIKKKANTKAKKVKAKKNPDKKTPKAKPVKSPKPKSRRPAAGRREKRSARASKKR